MNTAHAVLSKKGNELLASLWTQIAVHTPLITIKVKAQHAINNNKVLPLALSRTTNKKQI